MTPPRISVSCDSRPRRTLPSRETSFRLKSPGNDATRRLRPERETACKVVVPSPISLNQISSPRGDHRNSYGALAIFLLLPARSTTVRSLLAGHPPLSLRAIRSPLGENQQPPLSNPRAS